MLVPVLSLIVFLLCSQWVAIIAIFPFQVFYNRFKANEKNRMYKILATPYWLLMKVFRGGWDRYMLYKVGTIPSNHIRKYVYKSLGAKIKENVVFHFRTEIRKPYRLQVGGGTIIGDNAILDARNGLRIGDNVNMSSNVSIYTEQHDYRDPYFKCTQRCKQPVEICDYVWLGSNVIVLPGVKIGEGAVCCAGSVVTKDVDPYTVVAGIPAKKINDRPRDLRYIFNGNTCRLY